MANLQQLLNLDCDYPLIQAPMAGVQDSRLALAVAKAGAIGSIPCAMLSDEKLQSELVTLQHATDKPINLNFFCHPIPNPDPQIELKWRKLLSPYYDKYRIKQTDIKEGSSRIPFSSDIADLIEPFAPQLISFHFGLPDGDLLQRIKSWGTRIISSATTVAEAKWLESQGVDGVVAQGIEAGGHRGMFLREDLDDQLPTLELLQQILEEVHLPVIASGGIGDVTQIKECMSLGAAGVQVGTVYLCSREATTTKPHRKLLLSKPPCETAITNLFTGRPARGIVNKLMQDLGPLNEATPQFPLAANALVPLRKTTSVFGSTDFVPLWSGTNSGTCKVAAAKEITDELAAAFT